ncbi:MAG: DUF86 domain-containing protein [Anaerohalosphaeraceae bacterium]
MRWSELDSVRLRPKDPVGDRKALGDYRRSGGRVSPVFRDSHPEIPWRKVIGQRNVLAHEYGEIKQERIWKVVAEDIPALIRQLETLISGQPTP